jgi:hypothetical protein
LTLDEFKVLFSPGDMIEFYYPDSHGDKHYIFGIIRGYREPGRKYKDGGVDFYYYRLDKDEHEDLANLRTGDIGIDEINDAHHVDNNFFLLEI